MPNDMITSREMKALEVNAEYHGISRILLMENAGRAVAQEICKRFRKNKRIVVICGLGGNGGDGFVAARHLTSLGYKVRVILTGKVEDITDLSARQNLLVLRDIAEVEEIRDSSLVQKIEADVIVDAILGTGAKGPVRPPMLQLVRKINQSNAFCVAIDLPTGIDGDTGEVQADAIDADLTVTFYKVKPGLIKTKKYVGELVVKDIGLPSILETYSGPGDVQIITKPRPPDSHKGDFGRLLVIAGSNLYTGAAALVASAALRTGADLVYLATTEKNAYAVSGQFPDLITVKLEGDQLNPRNMPDLRTCIRLADAIAVGPGLGLNEETVRTVKELVGIVEQAGKPLLLDADGLKAFAQSRRKLKVPLVLTPHPFEYAVLTGNKLPERLDKKIQEVQRTSEQLGAVILLKGNIDIIVDPNRFKLNYTGNASMTAGGTGDVLTGIIAGLMAQKTDPFEAAVAGAFVNGAAGDFVFAEKGFHLVASDLIHWIPKLLDNPMCHLEVMKHVKASA